MIEQPSGTVTLVFTDIEGSTRLLDELGVDAYREALRQHRRVVRDAFGRFEGYEVDYEGDAFFYAFASARSAVEAVLEAMTGLRDGPIRIRVGVHTGEPGLDPPKYVGIDVHRAARIMSAGHGGQVLLSQSVRDLVEAEVRDLGEHRLKDLSGPQRLYQLCGKELADAFPPLKTLNRTNLPVPATSFLGREQELAAVVDLLGRDAVRLLNLTGPGGTGKTRLGLQVAAEIAGEYPDGVWWVPLAALRDSTLVMTAVAHTLGASDEASDLIGGKRMLLVLDNFEHVIEAASELGVLLAGCPRLDVLVTSRERLQLAGEHEYAVPPLGAGDGRELFAQRVRALRPEFVMDDAALELCERLDNLPLALELAAARVKLLSTSQLLQRLGERLDLLTGGRDIDPRQRTLRATIAWSYDLLTSEERELFARLSVFAGGCTLEAAEAVCDAEPEILMSLLDKSLVRRHDGSDGHPRFWMLETIREFASEALARDGQDLRDAYCTWYLAFAERAAPHLRATEAATWLDRLEAEHANVRQVIGYAIEDGDGEAALRLTGAIWKFWWTRGYWTEGRRWLDAALALEADVSLRVDPLWGASLLALWQVDTEIGAAHARTLLALSQAHGLIRGEAIALKLAGIAAAHDNDHEAQARFLAQALPLARETDDGFLISVILNNLGDHAMVQGQLDTAIEYFNESLAIGEARGDLDRRARALLNIGTATLTRGDTQTALTAFQQGLTASQEVGLNEGYVQALLGIAAATAPSDAGLSARLIGSIDSANEELDTEFQNFEANLYAATVENLRSTLNEAEWAAAYSQGLALSLDEAITLAREISVNS